MYEPRLYRDIAKEGFSLEIAYKESDILIVSSAEIEYKEAYNLLIKYYGIVEKYAKDRPDFLNSLSPLKEDSRASSIAKDMIFYSGLAGTGPFSAVAGAISFYVGRELLSSVDEIILENGGDIFIKTKKARRIGVYLGENSSFPQLGLEIQPRNGDFGIASSSSLLGHSLGFGQAELVTVIGKNSMVADAFATAFSNKVKDDRSVDFVLKEARKNDYLDGLMIVFKGQLYIWGDIALA
ncbi:MAG: UPF0280 family protein [Candidatus Omnitrophica bacterium]|nr:UPF0280 family protein [Candidatus Omnitrophota bacterium]MBD3269175.1 UPF0280 family protein [Candidatus Omnitrophota bacterium]